MHGREGENWKRRRRHMWPVPAPAPQAPPVIVPSSSSSPPDSSITSSVDSFIKDGRKIRVGDCALFHAVNAPPFIGIIRWFTTGKEDCLKLCVNWLYRPADVKLQKGILEAAPNEVFYSFHKDVISAATLLHPCKVAFLRKGVELPSGISSFICRRVYDIPNKCLWWLTDQDYIHDRQEEVDQLLDKTRLEMHAAVQSGGRSPKQLNGPPSTQQLKSGADSIQNSGTSFPSQAKGKKRERGGDQGTEPIKRERKLEDGETASSRLDNMIKAEMEKITEKGALTTTDGVEKLVHLMQLDRKERKIDLAGRILLADVIAATERVECLGRFVQLRAVPVLDEWLQEAHKGKIGDVNSPKDSDKSTDDLLLALLRALDKLPVNLNALQTCNVGKSVNHLRGHKNIEIQKKARSLVDTWKKRVDAEMTKINDTKSGGSNQAVTWPVKPGFSEASFSGSRRSGSTEATAKTITQPSTCKIIVGKSGHADAIVKSTPVTPGSLKLPSSLPASVSISSKDSPGKGAGSSGNSELPLTTVKEEKSSSSSQSPNNSQSCSSDHAKTMGSSWKEDARSSTAGSVNANKTSGGSSRHRRSNNGFMGSGICGIQKEASMCKTGSVNRSTPLDKVSSQSGISSERTHDMPGGSSHSRLIVRLPNPGHSPARSASGGSMEDPSMPGSRASSPAAHDKYDHIDRNIKLKGAACRSHISTDVNAESWQSNDVKEGLAGNDEGERSPSAAPVEEHRGADETERVIDAYKATCSSSGNGKAASLIEPKSRNSFSSMNALIESCAKYSEPSAPISAGDDIGINLLANVATGEISKSDLVSASASPGSSPKEEPSATNNEAKSRFACDDGGAKNCDRSDEIVDFDSVNLEKSDPLLASGKLQDSGMHLTGDSNIISSMPESKSTNMREGLKGDVAYQSVTDDNKPINYIREKIADGSTKTSDGAVNSLVDRCDNDLPPTCNTSDKLGANESSLINEGTSVADLADQPRPPVKENHVDTADVSGNDAIPSSTAEKVHCAEIADECRVKKADQLEGSSSAPNDSAMKEQVSSAPISNDHPGSTDVDTSIRVDESLGTTESLENHPVSSGGHEPTSAVPTQESEKCPKSIASKSSGVDPDRRGEIASSAKASSALVTSEPDTGSKLDFDLNEGFSGDDGNQNEQIASVVPVCSPAVRLPNLPPYASSMSNGLPAPVTVAAPAKGPFVPPENLLKSKGEPGWKGSAATSAFRPAEPRKVLEMQVNTFDVLSSDTAAGKKGRPPLNIDLNVPDDRGFEDTASQSSPQTTGSESVVISNRDAPTRSAGGFDLDLNKSDEGTDTGHYLASTSGRLEVPLMSVKPLYGGFVNGEANMLRDFDLNNGPVLDEVCAETIPKSQHVKNMGNMQFLSPISALRMGNTDVGNVSSWFPHGGSYPAVAIPSFLPDRGEQSYPIVAAPGSQRFLSSVTGSGTFGGDVYRGPVLSSSPAMAFPPSTAFPYAGFPFNSSFPLTSTSFTGGSAPYVDSSSGAASCFPAIPSQLVGPAGAVSSHYARPYIVGLPEGSASVAGSESNRKWGRQGLDLNAGPGSTEVDVRDDRIPSSASRQLPIGSSQAFMEEHARMYQVSGSGMKRKEREGGSWDERFYKQPSWQ